MKKSLLLPLALSALVFGCSRQTETTVMQYMPHMSNTPILKPQRGYEGNGTGAAVLMPPEHTVAIGHKPYRMTSNEEAGAKLVNPLPINRVVLERGKKVYNTTCYVCHGYTGKGDGPVVDPYPIPKSLLSADMMRWQDGHLFHVITKGQGVMPSYAQQVSPEDRWAVIHYVRALQRAENPTEQDVQEFKKRAVKN